jgi:hypothetical protein
LSTFIVCCFHNEWYFYFVAIDGKIILSGTTLISLQYQVSASVSTTGPSSIADLLESGQSAGKYAQGLREILRKMAKDDSKVQVQSLEQVIKLGQEIIVKESYHNNQGE